ncbi:MAG: tight adherence protein [Gaiellales bacterium]|jgi:tight adherence protein C|nr:tight adherence protein [Gaiellales bacterium]MDX6544377.1 tight adherence protein [Gaiellales bacterium]
MFLLAILLIAGSGFFMLRAATSRRLQVESTLGRIPGYGYGDISRSNDPRAWLRRIGTIAPGGRGAGAEALRRKLAAAGWSRLLTPEELAGLKVVLPLTVYLAMLMAALSGLIPLVVGAAGGLALAAVAYVGLPLAIDMRVRGRRDKIVAALPTVLDLLTLSVEAGMSFDAGLQRVVKRLRGPLIDELALMMRDSQLGATRSEALNNLAARVDASEMTSFVRALTQSDRLGVPLAQMLRTQADDLRHKLRNEAEEHAMKAPVKMLFPTVLLIFPAVFIVVLGPAVIQLMDKLS